MMTTEQAYVDGEGEGEEAENARVGCEYCAALHDGASDIPPFDAVEVRLKFSGAAMMTREAFALALESAAGYIRSGKEGPIMDANGNKCGFLDTEESTLYEAGGPIHPDCTYCGGEGVEE